MAVYAERAIIDIFFIMHHMDNHGDYVTVCVLCCKALLYICVNICIYSWFPCVWHWTCNISGYISGYISGSVSAIVSANVYPG